MAFLDLHSFLEESFYVGNVWGPTAWRFGVKLHRQRITTRAWNKADQMTEKYKVWRRAYRSRPEVKLRRNELDRARNLKGKTK